MPAQVSAANRLDITADVFAHLPGAVTRVREVYIEDTTCWFICYRLEEAKRFEKHHEVFEEIINKLSGRWVRIATQLYHPSETPHILSRVAATQRWWDWNHPREAPHRRPDYLEYLRSEEWSAFRRSVLTAYEHRCQDCGSQGRLEVHHLHYDTLGSESIDDVELLCRDCHEFAERIRRSRPHE